MDALSSELCSRGFTQIETHISRVFLRGDEVFKLKRPVELGFLDFTTLERREEACHAEVALNRRLAPDVYLGVSALVREGDVLAFRDTERVDRKEVIDWAVHMRRLSDDTRADVLLAAGRFERGDVERVACMLAQFHTSARGDAETAAFGEPNVIEANVEENFAQTEASVADYLRPEECERLRAYQRRFLRERRELFEARARDGHVRDGHGDLRLEHLYRTREGAYLAIDCIEFNDRFRYGDVCSDLAFLAMDLSHHGRADLAELLIAAYARERGDYGLYALLDFYQSYRAVVRAKIASMLAEDRDVGDATRARASGEARRYYMLALAAAARPATPVRLVVTFGLIASGKSTLADALGDKLAAPVLSADETRKRLLGLTPTTPRHDRAFGGAYTPEVSARVYGLLFERAEQVLCAGRSVVLDATFRARAQRQRARELAARLGVEIVFVECRCPRERAIERLRAREREPHVSDGREEIFDAVAASFESVADLPSAQHVIIDTTRPPAEGLALALASLGFEGASRLK